MSLYAWMLVHVISCGVCGGQGRWRDGSNGRRKEKLWSSELQESMNELPMSIGAIFACLHPHPILQLTQRSGTYCCGHIHRYNRSMVIVRRRKRMVTDRELYRDSVQRHYYGRLISVSINCHKNGAVEKVPPYPLTSRGKTKTNREEG